MKPLCLHPWISLDVSPQLSLKPCCKFTVPVAKSLAEYNASDVLLRAKTLLSDGLFPDECVRCKNDEAAGLLSKREHDLNTKFLIDNPSTNDPTMFLSLSFGNTCNLECSTCSPASSSKWNSLAKKTKTKFNITPVKNTNIVNTPLLDEVRLLLPGIKYLEIVGGEPLLYEKELSRVLSESKALTHLSITTNCTIFPGPDLISHLLTVKHCHFQLSIDGIGSMFETLRYPAKWEQVYQNIKHYQSLEKEDTITLAISHTVSVQNVETVYQFMTWCKKEKLPTPYLGMVSKPKWLSVTTLPPEIKNSLKNKVPSSVYRYMISEDNSSLYQFGQDYINDIRANQK